MPTKTYPMIHDAREGVAQALTTAIRDAQRRAGVNDPLHLWGKVGNLAATYMTTLDDAERARFGAWFKRDEWNAESAVAYVTRMERERRKKAAAGAK